MPHNDVGWCYTTAAAFVHFNQRTEDISWLWGSYTELLLEMKNSSSSETEGKYDGARPELAA